MATEDEVWIAEEATVSLWEINSVGTILPNPTIVTYAKDVQCRVNRLVMKKRQPGCAYEETRSKVVNHEIKMGRLFYDKAKDLDPLLDNSKRWRVLIQAENCRYNGVSRTNDQRDFRYCVPIEGPDMGWSGDSGELETPVTFSAEWEA